MRYFFSLRMGRALGAILFLVALLQYRSFEHRTVIGLWSYPFAILIIAAGVLAGLGITASVLEKWRIVGVTPQHRYQRASLDLAILLWAVSYFLGCVDNPGNCGNVADLKLFGWTTPLASLLGWISLCCVFAAVAIGAAPRPKGADWSANLMLLIGTLAVVGLMLEGGLRLKVAFMPEAQGFPTFSSAAWERRHAQHNREGFRDVDHEVSKSPGALRLAVVGDSFAYGWGISEMDHRFGEQLAAQLSKRTGRHWEPINASAPDTHTLHHLNFLERILPYEPDHVVLLYVFNDMDYIYPITPRGQM